MRFALNLLALIAAVDASNGASGKKGLFSGLRMPSMRSSKKEVSTPAAPAVTADDAPPKVDILEDRIQSAEPEQPKTDAKPEETMFTMTNILGLGAILAVIAGVAFFTFSK